MSARELERRAAELFEEAVELEPGARARLLDDAAGSDPELRMRVQSLLAAYDSGSTADVLPTLAAAMPPASLIGRRIGPYEVLELLGEGGMGAVYLAEREDVGQRVALKVIRSGTLATPEHVHRFLLERRILARLDHPAITSLHDAGLTDDGIPFLVMDLVQGEPIDRFADGRSLSIPARIELFLQVCDAVAYAHRALVVHRDLKPSNILVTDGRQVRLLDFGVAKLLDPQELDGPADFTRVVGAPLTPEYASPEQVRGEAITTASDLYSLGVVLYELLTGHRPYAAPLRTAAEIQRLVCETNPRRPSLVVRGGREGGPTQEAVSGARATRPGRLARALRGDLDTIVLKAMAKEPERRYHSAQELADDLRRHLAGLPVRARPDSVLYLSRKWIGRNRVAFAMGALAVVCLGSVGGFALRQALNAGRQRELALRSANAMVFQLADGLTRMTGPTEARLGLLTQAAAIFEAVGRAGQADRGTRSQMADGYRVLARTHRLLGDATSARRYVDRAEQEARSLAAGSGTASDRLLLADVLVELGDVATSSNDQNRATAAFGEAVALAAGLQPSRADSSRLQRIRYLAYSRLADRLSEREGAHDSAEALYRHAHTAAAALLLRDSADARSWTYYATTLERLADMRYYAGRIEEGCALYDRALAARRRALTAAPADPATRRALAVSLQNTGWCQEQEGHTRETLRLYDQANALLRGLLRDDPSNTTIAVLFMGGVGEVGNTLRSHGDLSGALRAFDEAVQVGTGLRARGVRDTRIAWKTAQVAQLYADALLASPEPARAGPVLARTRELIQELRRRAPEQIEYLRSLGELDQTESELHRARGDADARLAASSRSLAAFEQVAARTNLSQDRQRLAYARFQNAMALQQAGQAAAARAQLIEARRVLLELRAAGQLSDESIGATRYLPAVEAALRPGVHRPSRSAPGGPPGEQP